MTIYIAPLPRQRRDTTRRLTAAQVMECRALRLEGWKLKAIATKFGVTYPTIHNAIHGLGAYRETPKED